MGDLGSIPGLGRSPGGGNGNPLQYSCLEIAWPEEPGGLQSMGSQRVGHDRATKHSTVITHNKSYSCMEVPFIHYFNWPKWLPELSIIGVFKMKEQIQLCLVPHGSLFQVPNSWAQQRLCFWSFSFTPWHLCQVPITTLTNNTNTVVYGCSGWTSDMGLIQLQLGY